MLDGYQLLQFNWYNMKHKSIFYYRRFFLRRINSIYFLLFGTLLFFLISMLGLLISEYRFFCDQSKKMITLQQQYHAYLVMVKEKIEEPMQNFSLLEKSVEVSHDEQIKNYNISNIGMVPDDCLPLQIDQESNFLVVNRQIEYLKQSMFAHFKGQELDFLLPHIDQEWTDYNDHVSTKINNNVNKKIKKKKQLSAIIKCSWPIDQQSFWLSSLFGPRKKIDGSWGFHYGIDMAAMKGTPIKAAHSGNVIQAGYVPGYGNTIVIQYNKNFKTRYAHLDTISIFKGQKVKKGNSIGTVGDTGFIRKNGSDGSHLHFEVYKNGKQVDPLRNLPVLY